MNVSLLTQIGIGSFVLSTIFGELFYRLILSLDLGGDAMMCWGYVAYFIRPIFTGIMCAAIFQWGLRKWVKDTQIVENNIAMIRLVFIAASVLFSIAYVQLAISLTGGFWP